MNYKNLMLVLVLLTQAMPVAAEPINPGSALQMISALGLVIVIILALSISAKKLQGGFVKQQTNLKIEQWLSLGPKEKILIIRADDQRLLLGVSAAGIHLLDKLKASDDNLGLAAQIEKNTSPFASLLKKYQDLKQGKAGDTHE
ncbi:MAG: flagellar biosynthetic protein FliO [Gammaproteobacteria bacterium]|nr:flagellar biosynthetic protein FliO [Gammaproteobacteria bacterium]